jgi:glycosyltransferase involved in cell wall biosynthesis
VKILQVLGNSKFGGDTYLLSEWCNFLLRRGCEVHVLSTDATARDELARVRSLVLLDGILIPRDVELVAQVKAAWQLFRLIARERFDVVHTHTSTPGVVGRIAAWLARTPVRLHTAHGWPVSEYSGFMARLVYGSIERFAGSLSTRVICVSHATQVRGLRYKLAPPQKLVTIRNGIDPTPFMTAHPDAAESLRRELGIAPTALLIGTTNRLAPQKDVKTLLRAVARLVELLGSREFVLLLAGEGSETPTLRQLCSSLDIERHVRFLGLRRDIPALLSALDVFVTTSLWEGLSVSVLEAMAAAKPIVATDIEANAEVIEHERTGLVVPVQSPQQVASAIARFAGDSSFAARCGADARRRLLESFTIDRMCAEEWQLYEKLLESRTGPSRPATGDPVSR